MLLKKKVWLIIAISFFSILIVLLLLVSPIAKYVIEKNSVEWTGRQIRMDKLRINLLSGTLNIAGFKFYEQNQKDIFVSCAQISTSINLWRAVRSEFEIKQFVLSELSVKIIQKGDHFNYDDIIQHFSDSTSTDTAKSEPVKYWLKNLNLMEATISYQNEDYSSKVALQPLNLRCPVIAWNDPNENYDFSFKLGSGGDIKGTFAINIEKLNYALSINSEKINLSVLYPYLKPYIKIKAIDGLLSTDVNVQGNFNKPEDVISKVSLKLEKFALIDTLGAPLMSMGLFEGGSDSVNTATNYHDLNSFHFIDTYLHYESYDDGDNWTRLMAIASAESGTEVDTMDYTNPFRLLSIYLGNAIESYSTSTYLIDSLVVKNMEVQYDDYTLPTKFSFNLDQMNLVSGSLNTSNDRLKFNFDARLNKKGYAKAFISVNPRSYHDMELTYSVAGLPIASFNPYMTYYVAWPFATGDIHCSNESTIEKGYLKSQNKLQVLKVNMGEKVKEKPQYKVPVKLAVGLLKDVKGNIDFDIPVEGDLNDPQYKVMKVVWKILGNLMVKAVTAPYNLLARAIGGSEEDIKDIAMNYTQAGFTDKQYKTIDKIAHALKAKPEVKVVFTQQNDSVEEIDQLATVEARRKFAMSTGAIQPGDTIADHVAGVIDSISVKDSAFINYLNSSLGATGFAMSVQDKCKQVVGVNSLITLRETLIHLRQQNLQDYLIKDKGIDPSRITFREWRPAHLDPGSSPRFTYEIQVPPEENPE